MENIHAIRDEIVRSRNRLVIALNELHRKDPEAAQWAFQLSITHIDQYFEGSKTPEPDNTEDVEEKGNIEP